MTWRRGEPGIRSPACFIRRRRISLPRRTSSGRAASRCPSAPPGPPPEPFKPARGRGTRLPLLPRAGQFARVLLDRRTWRVFGREPLERAALGTLLDLTFGVTMNGRAEDGAEVVFKTSPSSGSCHPIEAYVLALRVRGLARGLYHYAPATGTLHLIRRGASRDQIDAYIPGQWWFRDTAALVFMTAVLPRVRWRYASPRAYRSVLLGAGHLCQTFCLVATWLKLAPYLYPGARRHADRTGPRGGRRQRGRRVRRRRRHAAAGRAVGPVARARARPAGFAPAILPKALNSQQIPGLRWNIVDGLGVYCR